METATWHGMAQRKTKVFVSPRPVIPGRTTQYSLPTKLDHIPLLEQLRTS